MDITTSGILFVDSRPLITHKYSGSQQFSRVEYSSQIYWFDTRGAKEYYQVLAAELSIQQYLDKLISVAKYLVAKWYDSSGNSGKSKDSSFLVIVTVATEK